MNERYYAHTAYDSTNPRHLHPADENKFGAGMRGIRDNKLTNYPSAQCREFYASLGQASIIKDLNSKKKELLEAKKAPHHEYIYWRTLLNPNALLDTFIGIMGIMTVCFYAGLVLMSIIALLLGPEWFFSSNFAFAISFASVPLLLFILGKKISKKNMVRDKNNIIFNRHKGLVEIPNKKGPPRIVRFDEFDPCLGKSYNPSGSVDYHLVLSHRYSATLVQHPGASGTPWMVCVEWEYLQQYMDVSKPLPDIPCMEPYRSRDPVTAAHDKQHNRPENYWKDMDLKKAEQMNEASYEAASKYPWGLTREQALAKGWQPSGVGEGDWKQTQ